MQVVIDIPDEDYQKINSKEKIITLSCNITDVIKNGTPLPKGHGKLYEENEIKNEAVRREWTSSMYYTLDHMLSYMKPTVEADRGK